MAGEKGSRSILSPWAQSILIMFPSYMAAIVWIQNVCECVPRFPCAQSWGFGELLDGRVLYLAIDWSTDELGSEGHWEVLGGVSWKGASLSPLDVRKCKFYAYLEW